MTITDERASKTDPASAQWTDRYLQVLGIPREAPSLAHLTALIDAQFRAVPFENVTSLMRRGAIAEGPVPAVDLAHLLDNWEAKRGGGVCFETVAMFRQLLTNLGYDVRRCLAQISIPDGHQALLVTLDGNDWLVDVGTGSPVFRPIPLDQPDALTCGGVHFRFHADGDPRYWLQERLIDGEWKRSCRYDLGPTTDEPETAAYQMHHTYGQSWVVDTLRMVRWRDNVGYSVSGNELTTLRESGKTTEIMTDPARYRHVVADIFGVPDLPIVQAQTQRPTFAPTTPGNS